MNENKIRLIADEASEWCKKNAHGAPAAWEWEYKFAELIVKDCIRYFNEDYERDWDKLWRDNLSQKLKEHFGVK